MNPVDEVRIVLPKVEAKEVEIMRLIESMERAQESKRVNRKRALDANKKETDKAKRL